MKHALFLVLAFSTASALAADAPAYSNLKGWISDSKCGAKHAGSGSDCVRKCVAGGDSPVFVDEATRKVWAIDDPRVVMRNLGQHVAVVASSDSAKNSVHVLRVTVMPN